MGWEEWLIGWDGRGFETEVVEPCFEGISNQDTLV